MSSPVGLYPTHNAFTGGWAFVFCKTLMCKVGQFDRPSCLHGRKLYHTQPPFLGHYARWCPGIRAAVMSRSPWIRDGFCRMGRTFEHCLYFPQYSIFQRIIGEYSLCHMIGSDAPHSNGGLAIIEQIDFCLFINSLFRIHPWGDCHPPTLHKAFQYWSVHLNT